MCDVKEHEISQRVTDFCRRSFPRHLQRAQRRIHRSGQVLTRSHAWLEVVVDSDAQSILVNSAAVKIEGARGVDHASYQRNAESEGKVSAKGVRWEDCTNRSPFGASAISIRSCPA